MELTYLSNSGFLLSDGRTALIFDDEGRCPDIINRAALERFDAAVFFVSHSHGDHFSPGIFSFSDVPGVQYVLSDDVPTAGLPEGVRAALQSSVRHGALHHIFVRRRQYAIQDGPQQSERDRYGAFHPLL